MKDVRNFWVTVNVDGRESEVATGPRSKDGGFEILVKMRQRGEVMDALYVRGFVQADGSLTLWTGISGDAYEDADSVQTKPNTLQIRTTR